MPFGVLSRNRASPQSPALEGEVWIGRSFAQKSRWILSTWVDSQESILAGPLVARPRVAHKRTAGRFGSVMGWIPTKRHFAFDITFSRAFFERENRETPPSPVDRAPPALLCAGRQRTGQAPPSDRGNKEDRLWPLPCRGGHYFLCRKAESQQENRRFARLTLAFSKKRETLKDQLTLYRDLYNCCHPHRGLRQRGPQPVQGKTYRKWQLISPAMAGGVTDHVWSLREPSVCKTFIDQ